MVESPVVPSISVSTEYSMVSFPKPPFTLSNVKSEVLPWEIVMVAFPILFEACSNPIGMVLLLVPPITRPITVTRVVSTKGIPKVSFLIKLYVKTESG